MLWIKEVEMVDSLDELKASRSVSGKNFANFEMLDAKIASARNKIQNSQFKKKVSLEESPGWVSTKKTDRLHDERPRSNPTRTDTSERHLTQLFFVQESLKRTARTVSKLCVSNRPKSPAVRGFGGIELSSRDLRKRDGICGRTGKSGT